MLKAIPSEGFLKIRVRPNAKKTQIVSIDPDGLIHLDVAAPPKDNKANTEILKFFARELKEKVIFVRGLKSKEKVLKILK